MITGTDWVPHRVSDDDASAEGELGMPVWTVETAGGDAETVEAGMLATEFGALVALSEEGLLLRAWAPGRWQEVRLLDSVCPAPKVRVSTDNAVLVGLPRG